MYLYIIYNIKVYYINQKIKMYMVICIWYKVFIINKLYVFLSILLKNKKS